jgi:UPF0755 protein
MWKHVAANALTLLVVALVVLGGVLVMGQRMFYAEGPLEQAMCLRVEPGANLRTVARHLDEQKAISSPVLFRIGAQYTERDDRLRFGAYLIERGASMDEILDTVTRGGASTCGTEVVLRVGVTRSEFLARDLDPETGRFEETSRVSVDADERPEELEAFIAGADTRFRLVVVEGVTSWQVWSALNAAPFLAGELAEVPEEGRLAPGSYEVRRGQERAAVIADITARQEAILTSAWENRAEDVPVSSPEEALILASIVEKEAGGPLELPQVASVFYNRMANGMRFQMDATIIYGITRGQGILDRPIRRSDIDGATERQMHGQVAFNTYVIDGLPPTPIANPGRAAIEAVLNPDDTPYLFFVADGTGGHAFATSLAEHNSNVARWREIEAQQRSQ